VKRAEDKLRWKARRALQRIPGVRRLALVRCLHPSYLWTPCQLTWWNGIYGWWTRCTRCGYTKACTP
jgi:hypothetical protein